MSKLVSFFEQYRVALATSNDKAIAKAYADHFMISATGGQRYLKNGRNFRNMLRRSNKFYEKVGVADVKIAKFNCSVMDRHHAGVQVEWQLLDADGKELIRHNVSYVIFVDHHGVRIIFFVSHNEEEQWRTKGYL